MGTQPEGHRGIAETLIAVPRYLSRDKIRLLGVDGVAAVVASIAADPDEYTKSFRDKPTGLGCAVCGKVKHQIYFGWDKYSENEPLRVCRYCRWRIKSRADEQYRNKKGLPSKPTKEEPEERTSFLRPEQIHRCPVCGSDHSWRDKTYTFTPGFYGVPQKYREICFDCFVAAINTQSRSYPTRKDLDGVLEISRIIEDLPSEDMFKVVTQQAKTLEAATSVVRILKETVRFGTLKRKYGSWFAVLARSGCLPEGSRKEVYGTRILAKDGHECLSMAEMQIDDELHGLRIPHRKEVRYPNATFVCDWVVPRGDELVFIEFFGLSGRPDYDEKILQKRAALVQAGHELIELYHEDLLRLKERLASLVSSPDGRRKRKSPPEP